MNGYRKFFLASFASFAATMLCWNHCMSGAEFVTVQSIVLGLYKASNIIDKKMGGAG